MRLLCSVEKDGFCSLSYRKFHQTELGWGRWLGAVLLDYNESYIHVMSRERDYQLTFENLQH